MAGIDKTGKDIKAVGDAAAESAPKLKLLTSMMDDYYRSQSEGRASLRDLKSRLKDSTAAVTQHSLAQEKYTKISERVTAEAKEQKKKVASLTKAISNYQDKILHGVKLSKTQEQDYESTEKALTGAKKAQKLLNTQLKETEKRIKAASKSMVSAEDGVERNIAALGRLKRAHKDVADVVGRKVPNFWGDASKYAGEYKSKLEAIKAIRIGKIKKDLEEGVITPETAGKQIVEADAYAKNQLDPGGKARKKRALMEKAFSSNKTPATIEAKEALSGSFNSSAKELKSNLGRLFKGDGSAIADLNKQRKSYLEMRKAASGAVTGGGKLISTFGLLGKAMGAIVSAGWLGALVSAIGALVKGALELDKVLKNANQAFFEFSGPITATEGLKDAARDFTDSMYNATTKMKYGVDAEDIKQVYSGMSSEGMSSAGVQKSFGSYDKAIESSIVLSKTFNVSLSDMGGMIADQMLNLRGSLDDVSDAFGKMSFDAEKAGISSSKFYQQIMNASSGLSYYGNYLKSTSGLLGKIATEGTMGFKDAAKNVEGLLGAISNMGESGVLTMSGMLGTGKMQSNAEEVLTRDQKAYDAQLLKLQGAKSRVSGTTEGSEEREAAEKDLATQQSALAKLEANVARSEYAAKSDDLLAKGVSSKRLYGGDPIRLIKDQMDALNIDFTNLNTEQLSLQVNNVGKLLGMSEEVLEGQMDRVKLYSKRLDGANITGDLAGKGGMVGEAPVKATLSTINNLFEKFNAGSISQEEYSAGASSALGALGKDEKYKNFANALDKLQKLDPSYITTYVDALSKDGTMGAGAIKKTLIESSLMTGSGGSTDAMNGELAAGIAKLTTPLTKFYDIGKEQLTYAAASSDPMREMLLWATETAQNTGGILDGIMDLIRYFTRLSPFTSGNIKKWDEDKSVYTNAVAGAEAAERELSALKAKEEGGVGLNTKELLERPLLEKALKKHQETISTIEGKKEYTDLQSQIRGARQVGMSQSYTSTGQNNIRAALRFDDLGEQYSPEQALADEWAKVTDPSTPSKDRDAALSTLVQGETAGIPIEDRRVVAEAYKKALEESASRSIGVGNSEGSQTVYVKLGPGLASALGSMMDNTVAGSNVKAMTKGNK